MTFVALCSKLFFEWSGRHNTRPSGFTEGDESSQSAHVPSSSCGGRAASAVVTRRSTDVLLGFLCFVLFFQTFVEDWFPMVRAPTCPICNLELAPSSISESPVFPFCSVRCKQIDLLRWCKGEYAVVDRLTPEEIDELLASRRPAEDDLSVE